jgi:hypothetical protein
MADAREVVRFCQDHDDSSTPNLVLTAEARRPLRQGRAQRILRPRKVVGVVNVRLRAD